MREKIQSFQEQEGITEPEKKEALTCKAQKIEPWRVFRIMSEFVEGFETLQKYGLAATFFGTARCTFNDQVYRDAEALAGKLAEKGFTIITGGSKGVMEAANKGAFEAKGNSVGMSIALPNEQKSNKYLTDEVKFDHFFVRKVMLAFASEVYVYFPGGFGTMDELFEILTLIQTKKIQKVPVVLVGKRYWTRLLEFIDEQLYQEYNAINKEDRQLYYLADTVDEAYEYIISHVHCE